MKFTAEQRVPTLPAGKYPRLMQLKTNAAMIVLFTKADTGMPLKEDGFGPSQDKWLSQECWEPFVGTITVTP